MRHDNKVREQVQSFQREVLYFNRLKTGLLCALTLGPKEHEQGLRAIVGHLLAAPPTLVSPIALPAREPDVPLEAATNERTDDPTKPFQELAVELMKEASNKAKDNASP